MKILAYHLFPPLLLPPPPLPPRHPPPPPLLLSSLSRATVTEIALPSISLLLRPVIAALPSSSDGISTNPKPRDLPVSLSIIILADATWPYWPNIVFKSSSLV